MPTMHGWNVVCAFDRCAVFMLMQILTHVLKSSNKVAKLRIPDKTKLIFMALDYLVSTEMVPRKHLKEDVLTALTMYAFCEAQQWISHRQARFLSGACCLFV